MFFEDDELGCVVSRVPAQFDMLVREVKEPDLISDEELLAMPVGSAVICDTESYPNYFCAAFRFVDSGKVVYFEDSPDESINIEKLLYVLWHFKIITFYGNSYDIVTLSMAISGHKAAQMHIASNQLIVEGMRPDEVLRYWKTKSLHKINHIDLESVAPLDGSLKLYGARLFTERLQDLPYPVGTVLTRVQARHVLLYCCNDLTVTLELWNDLALQIQLREALGEEYQQDLRSKSDAQIAEAVINSELAKLNGFAPKRPRTDFDANLFYDIPNNIKFKSPELNKALQDVAATGFKLGGGGSPLWPEGLGTLEKDKSGKLTWMIKVNIGGNIYKMGMGGLHSTEKSVAHIADADTLLIDRDVASYYPAIILLQRLYPKHLGEGFLKVFKIIVDRRLAAKKAKNKTVSDSLKITINGTFGKLGDMFSTLFSPQLLLQVTLSGQFYLLMLIEMITGAGIPVVSANTDGIVIKCPKSRYKDLNAIIAMWESITKFDTEETRYSSLYSRDVNNYIAVKDFSTETEDDKAKRAKSKYLDELLGCKPKGAFSEKGSALNSPLSKNPETLVCIDAVMHMLVSGTPVADTIYGTKDFRRFISVKRARDGAFKDTTYLGKVVRWYYALSQQGGIYSAKSGNIIAKSEGCKVLMDMPSGFFANDVDYEWYIAEANDMLLKLGFYAKPQQSLFG